MRRIGKSANKYLEAVADLFIPRTCCICGGELRGFEKSFCTECFAELPFTFFWHYRSNPAKDTFVGRTNIEDVIALMVYKGEIREAMHNFKYHGQIGIGEELGELLGNAISTSPFMVDALKEGITIVPIPLHRRKKRKRGYNQAEVIARGVQKGIIDYMLGNTIQMSKDDAGKSNASKSNASKSDTSKSDASKSDASKNNAKSEQNIIGKIIVEPHLLKRVRFTNTQTRLNKLERFKNINDAFEVNEKRLKRYCSKKKRKK